MAKQTIGIGAAPNDGNGDPARTWATKSNDNFTELYNSTNGALGKFDATAAPTANDDAADTSTNGVFAVNSVWIDVTNDVVYQCVDSTATAAVWKNISAVSELADTTTGVAHADGADWVVRKDNMAGTVAPTANEDTGDGYIIGSKWFDTTADKFYIALDVTSTAAVWKELSFDQANYAFDIQFSIDITAGAGDYVIHDDSIFAYEIDSINACTLDLGTATITVKINTTVVTGISVAATTTKQTTADPSAAASSVVATDEVSITVASPVSSPTLLTGVLHCSRTITF